VLILQQPINNVLLTFNSGTLTILPALMTNHWASRIPESPFRLGRQTIFYYHMAQNRKAFLYRTVFRQKLQSNFKNKYTLFNTAVCQTQSAQAIWLTKINANRENTKQKNIFGFSHVSLLKQPRSQTEMKTNSCKAKYHDSVRVESMLFVVNNVSDKHLHPSHRKTRRV